MNKKLLNRFLSEEKGQSIVLLALSLAVMLGIMAFTVDFGYLQWQKRHLQNTADAAALAGVRELADGDANSISSVVVNYVEEHGFNATDIINMAEIQSISSGDTEVPVELRITRDLFFARVLGFQSSDVTSRAVAATGPPRAMEGLIPIGVQQSVWNSLPLGEGHVYITKDNFGTHGSGNWGWVNLAYPQQPSTPIRRGYIMNGYDGTIRVNDTIQRDTGANLTNDNNLKARLLEYKAGGITLYIPIVCDTVSPGQSQPITVLGFAAIIITDFGGQGANFWLEAKANPDETNFIPGGGLDPNAPDYGLKVIALVE